VPGERETAASTCQLLHFLETVGARNHYGLVLRGLTLEEIRQEDVRHMLRDSILISPKGCLQRKLIESFQLISDSVVRYGALESLVRLLF
jgi:hypothetical protein